MGRYNGSSVLIKRIALETGAGKSHEHMQERITTAKRLYMQAQHMGISLEIPIENIDALHYINLDSFIKTVNKRIFQKRSKNPSR